MRGRLPPSSHLNTLRGSIKGLFKEFTSYIAKFNNLPTIEALKIEIDAADRLTDEQYRSAMEILPDIFKYSEEDLSWLVERTEKWCQDRGCIQCSYGIDNYH